MARLLAVLALAVSCVGCAACGGPGCCNQVCGVPAGCGAGCYDDCGCCEDSYACGGGCCDAGCCGECGCEPTCGCGTNCGGGCCAGGCVADAAAGCPICQDCRNCCLFRRGCQACGYDQCGCECGTGPYPADYDYSACYGDCNSHNHWPKCCGCCCGCCETYSGCCCQPQGPGCCASGDHMYNFNPGPPVGQVAYPYYTVRGPRDFLMANPPSIGPY